VPDIAKHLSLLMNDEALRNRLGKAGRIRVVDQFDYRIVAKKFMAIMEDVFGFQ